MAVRLCTPYNVAFLLQTSVQVDRRRIRRLTVALTLALYLERTRVGSLQTRLTSTPLTFPLRYLPTVWTVRLF